jgi:hypothetical protein
MEDGHDDPEMVRFDGSRDKCHGKASAEMCNRSLEMPKKVSRPTTSRGLVKVAVRAPVVIRQMP